MALMFLKVLHEHYGTKKHKPETLGGNSHLGPKKTKAFK